MIALNTFAITLSIINSVLLMVLEVYSLRVLDEIVEWARETGYVARAVRDKRL
jgi:hypothetical protein